jgi:DNA adenine methylase
VLDAAGARNQIAPEASPRRPIVRYHGGKWKLAPWIISNFPEHRVYVEPFGGGGSVLLRKPRSYAEVYNDLDGEMVNLFRVARDRGDELRARLELTPFARDEFTLAYEAVDDPLEQARRTVTRSFMGFGSAAASGAKTGFRSNSNRSGTTPAHGWRNFPDALVQLIDRLRGVVIENRCALDLMEQHDNDQALHYCDPPYVLATRKLKNPYCRKGYRHELTDDDHRDFAETVRKLRGSVVIRGYGCPLYDELFGDWARVERAAHADGARDRIEVLWLNRIAASAQQRLIA